MKKREETADEILYKLRTSVWAVATTWTLNKGNGVTNVMTDLCFPVAETHEEALGKAISGCRKKDFGRTHSLLTEIVVEVKLETNADVLGKMAG